MKRPLVWLAVAFAAALLLLTNLPSAAYVLPLAAAVAAFGSLRLVPPAVRSRALVICAAVLLACGANGLWEHRAAPFAPLDGKETAVRMTVLSEEEGSGYSLVTLHGKVLTPKGWKTATVRAFSHGILGWQAGDRVEGTLLMQHPKGQSDRRFLFSHGRLADGQVVQLQPMAEDAKLSAGPKVWGAVLNRNMSDTLTKAISGEKGAFVQSVLLGRREQISDYVDENMRRSGAAHVMVVSGLHLSLICGGVVALLRRSGANRWLQLLGGALACGAVMAVAGFTPSVTRGGIMLLLALGAGALARRSDPFSSLAAAVTVMGLCNPYILYSWSFLLSVGSMLSVLTFVPPLQKALLKWRRERFPTAKAADGLLGLAALSLGASVYTYPMLSVMFGGLPLYGLLGNLLITPLMGVLLVSAAAAALIGMLGWSTGAALVAVPAGAVASFCQSAAAFIAKLPLAWLPINRRWQEVWLLAAAAVFTLLVYRRSKKLWRLGMALLMAVLLIGTASSALLQTDAIELYTFEGSSSLVVVADGQAVVIDADAQGAAQADRLAKRQVLYSFRPDSAQSAALVLQQYQPAAAVLDADTAQEIAPYLPEEIQLLSSDHPAVLSEYFRLTVREGYSLLETDGLQVLKLLDGYVIIKDKENFPVADIVVDGEGMIHTTAQQGPQAVRSLCFRADGKEAAECALKTKMQ